ncbi:hypothetical protein DL769_009356 [Monosporascus sp. CRB-8-3]|nr:hypothetical protein DL769_009356 [Monosporascus sp. CRB-8-3]
MSGRETTSVHRIGFTQLTGRDSPEPGSYKVNIIFIHGLRGHPQTTWEDSRNKDKRIPTPSKRTIFKKFLDPKREASTASNSNGNDIGTSIQEHKVFWPRDFLTEDIPEARVWTYGYNADAIGGLFAANNQNSVSQHGRDLAVRLEREIPSEVRLYPKSYRETVGLTLQGAIIFVAHSLGGIIVKDAIHRSEICRLRTKFIVFLGTPHRGSSFAGWGGIASNLASVALQDSNKRILKTLKVVDNFSSKIGLPRPMETVESIDANHMDIARCGSKTDVQYRAILGVLKQFILIQLPYDRESGVQKSALATASGTRVIGQVRAAQDEAEMSQSNCVSKPHYYIPLPKNRRFTGRNTILETLKTKLFIQNCQKLAVVGLGGVGKTQVALQLAYWVKENQSEYSIFWVPALSDGSFDQAYTEIARHLDIRIQKDDELKETVRQHLESEKAGKWLLVVDNADDMDTLFGSPNKPGGISKHLPDSENGLTLFTTRSREVAVSLVEGDLIDLEEMSSEEAMGFFQKTLTQKRLDRDEAVIKELLQELAHLPLAIAQAVAYLNANQIPIKRRFKEAVTALEEPYAWGREQAGKDNRDQLLSEHWLACAYLGDRRIKDAIEILEHVVAVKKETLKEKDHSRLVSEHKLAYAYLVDRRIKEAIEKFEYIVAICQKTLEEKDQFRLASEDDLARAYLEDRRIKDAIEKFEYVVAVRRKTLKEEDYSRLISEHELASAYLDNRQIKDAIGKFEYIVAIQRKTLEEEDQFRLASEHELARAYLQDRRIKDAIKKFEYVMAVRRKTLKEEDYDRLISEHELARAYLADGRIKDAIEKFEYVVAVQRKTLEEEDHFRLATEHQLARAYLADSRIKDAIETLVHVTTVRGSILNADHPDRVASQELLTEAYSMPR